MAILAFDSSETTASVAVLEEDKIICEISLNAGLTHSQTLLPMVEFASKTTGINEFEQIAVTVGPGSFTGVRIAVATAKGLAFSKDIACKEVSSLEALAYNCRGIKGKHTICAMFDARLKRVYTALFVIENGVISRISEDECLEINELEKRLSNTENLIILGDGVKVFTGLYENYKENLLEESENYIKASSVAFASKDKEILTASKINPLYLQLPQAERERLERLKKMEETK